MKNVLLYMVALLLLGTSACRRAETDFLNPNVHSFKVNSASYTGGTYDALYKAGSHNITANLYVTEKVSDYIRLSVSTGGDITPGVYTVGVNNGANGTTAVKYVTGSKTYTGAYGTIHITEFDVAKSRAAGTFTFKAGYANGDSVTVTQGTFEGLRFIKD